MNLPIGTLHYHLHRLGRRGLVSLRLLGGYLCAYPERTEGDAASIPDSMRVLIALLRQPVPRSILMELYLDGPAPPAALARSVATSGPNLAYFLRRLEGAGLVVREGRGAERRVRLTQPGPVYESLVKFRPLPEPQADRFLQFWSELHP